MMKAVLKFLVTTSLVVPATAWAQEAVSDEQGQGGLEEIVVTAQKRAEGLSDVPISISAVSGETIEAYGQTNLEAVSSSIPNLKITQTAIANRIAIRGIASGDNKGFEQSVAMFVDGIYYGRDQLSRMPLVDLQRVEVLRGPQPTLFGKNAIAGAVNVVSRRPTEDFEGSLSGLYEFNHKEAQVTGVLSGPISQNVGARVVGYYRDMDGYFTNTRQNRKEPNVREAFVRGIVDFKGGGPLSADVKLEYADFKVKGQPREAFSPVGIYSAVFAGPLFVDTTEDYVRADGGYLSRNKIFNSVLNANLELGSHTLTSVTGYLDYNVKETIDVDFVTIDLLDGTGLTEDYRQFSQELRLASPGDQPFNYIGGVYFQNSKLDITDVVRFSPFFLSNPGFRALGDTTNDRIYSQKSDLISVFAQGEISITDALRLTVGARFNHEKKSGNRSLAQYALEPGGTAVIRIGHFGFAARCELHKQPNLVVLAGLRLLHKHRVIIAVHRDDVIESLEVLGLYASRTNIGQRIASASRGRSSTTVGGLVNVIGVRAGRVDIEMLGKTRLVHQVPKHAFRGRRTADIAHAHEKYSYG